MEKDTTFKEHFFFELQRRDSLNNSLSLLVGIVALLLGGTLTMSKGASLDASLSNIFRIVTLLLTTAALAATVYYMIRSIFGYTYAYFPDTKEMLKTRGEFISFYAAQHKCLETAKSAALEDYAAEVEAIYAECTARNGGNNDERAAWAHKANRWLVISLVLFAVAGVAYLTNTVGAPDKPVRVLIDNLE
ncbi:hypothetical protein ACGFZ3_13455 [Stenotrophomonas sp. NPDC047960]|uniref:hypothetical protein n=1 Tax=Stenotrophomonas sp. NPDC047960 TaxID=3364531 RepID=UPI003712D073